MDYKREIRFQYYQLFYEINQGNKGKKRQLFDFAQWLMKMNKGGYIQKTEELYDTLARIDKIQYDAEHKLWFVRFMKLRDINLPSKVKENAEARVIELEDDEYIGEDMTMLYDEASSIVMAQQNRFSLGLSRIAELIKKTIKRNDITIDFAPFLDVKSNKLKNCDFRNVEITFANLTHFPTNDSGKRTLANIISTYKSMGAITGKVFYSLGHSKIDSLNGKVAEELVYDLNEHREYIRSAKVKVLYGDDENNEIEMVDLFESVVQDFLEFTLHSREPLEMNQIVMAMTARYLKRKGELYEMAKIDKPFEGNQK